MARPENTQDSVEIRISTTPMVKKYLQQLVDSGTWGKNVTEAAERIISTSLDGMVRRGELVKLPPSNNKLGQ
jgi:hypothetical protein